MFVVGVVGAVGGVIAFFKRYSNKYILGGALFGILILAVIDEFIQGFGGRNSSVWDVILDFGSAVIGLGLTVFTLWFVNHIKKKKE